MKIAHLVHNFPPEFSGGTELYVVHVAKAHVDAGHEVVVIAGTDERDPEGRAREHEHEGLRPAFEHLTPLGPLSEEGLRRALTEPARREGFSFEDEALVGEMLESVEDARGALPLLAFAVARLWERRDRERALLTRQAYNDIGGVGGALARHAEETVDRIGFDRVAVVREPFGKRFQTTGLDSPQEAHQLALLLRAGALAAPIEIVEERTIGPSLGQDNIDQGFTSVMVGMGLVLIFMAVYYKAFGLVANLALVSNLFLIVAVLSILQATLTLPGIAGIVLTVGMAVDANVLIFERIREELRNGNTPQASIRAGYDKAFSTIADANITTLIAAFVLFLFGTGPIKGFAVTLSLGIVTSMFTAIMGTRAVINLVYGGRKRVKKLAI